MKICKVCREERQDFDFYKCKSCKGGKLPKCKICHEFYKKFGIDRFPPLLKNSKICYKCKVEKSFSEFPRDKYCIDGISNRCKSCQKIYYKQNKSSILERFSRYTKDNRQKLINYSKNYREINKKKIKEKRKNWEKQKLDNDPFFKLSRNIRCLIRNSIKNRGYKKSSKTHKILGCSFEDFKNHIESKFENWMNWENYGKYNGEKNYGWEYDHIIPISSAKTEKEIIQLNHYSNFQPLCTKYNRYIKKNIHFKIE